MVSVDAGTPFEFQLFAVPQSTLPPPPSQVFVAPFETCKETRVRSAAATQLALRRTCR